ncbi:MAG: alpha/beta hydrolase [Anaerolineae bacterium]
MRKLLNWKRILFALLVIVILITSGFVIWANNPLPPMPEALAAIESDSTVTVTIENGWYTFRPIKTRPTTGFIFYPGGRVDARAYAPQLRAIAEQGYLTVITPMPLNLAIFGLNQASDVIKAYPEIQHWGIGGHSLGGAMAARFVQSNPSAVEGIVFWASYPDIDLSTFSIKAVSIFGTNDAVAQSSGIQNSDKLLPASTPFIAITGGNHSGFGWYDLQPGDNEATISHTDQMTQTVAATANLLADLSK